MPHRLKLSRLAVVAGVICVTPTCAPLHEASGVQRKAERMVTDAFAGTASDLGGRAVQDPSQELCSKDRAKLSSDEAAELIRLARSSIRYPASGVLVADWKLGEKIALDGSGQRIRNGQIEAVRQNGGNCYACHALDPTDINAGNLGPSLTRYGALRGNSEEAVRYTYDKIYNAWATLPCSGMPRMGANNYLTPEQIAHVVAYLLDPSSPVNK